MKNVIESEINQKPSSRDFTFWHQLPGFRQPLDFYIILKVYDYYSINVLNYLAFDASHYKTLIQLWVEINKFSMSEIVKLTQDSSESVSLLR